LLLKNPAEKIHNWVQSLKNTARLALIVNLTDQVILRYCRFFAKNLRRRWPRAPSRHELGRGDAPHA